MDDFNQTLKNEFMEDLENLYNGGFVTDEEYNRIENRMDEELKE